jgi:microsomal dipeptidase-like Zn-dependent dipeptidase
MLKKVILILIVIVTVAAVIFFGYVPRYFDMNANVVSTKITAGNRMPDYDAIPFIADLHCDMLLWDRDFFREHDYGHVDLPRMLQGNMAMQVFSIVSKVPQGINIERNDDKTDQIAWLSFGQLRPAKTWFSIKERALHQINQLHEFAEKSEGKFRVITNKSELQRFVMERKANRQLTSGMLGLEGAHCLENDLNNLDVFYNTGVRYIGITHFFDNEWGGSAHGVVRNGLTESGKALVRKMNELDITIDLAHASPKVIDDVLALTIRPVLVSHTGLKSVCNNQRNLSDEHLIAIGKLNGLVGVGLWETSVCGTDAAATAKSIRYVADKIGVDKVALGSDFDGAIGTHFDVTGLPLMVSALEQEGFSRREIEMVMGGNIRDFFLKNLPD